MNPRRFPGGPDLRASKTAWRRPRAALKIIERASSLAIFTKMRT
jgi:hypothetical protein